LESSALVEITAPFAVPCWGCEKKPAPVKLRLGGRKAGKQTKSRVQSSSYWELIREAEGLCLKDGQKTG